MRYHEAANTLLDLRRHPPKPGTASTAAVLDALDVTPPDTIQIAGTNGKGSTARMLESVLRASGRSVGLYTSPHLDDLRERVRVDGRRVPKTALCSFVEAIDDHRLDRAAADDPVTFFEATTALAYWWFDRRDVDLAVVEVGIGGHHDATSVVDPVASAVTTVEREHTDVLGDTIAEIARDKAHVAPGVGNEGAPSTDAEDRRPLVTAATGEALAAIREVAPAVTTVGRSAPTETEPGQSDGHPDPDGPDVTVTYHGRDGREAGVTIEGAPVSTANTGTSRGETNTAVASGGWTVETALPLIGAHQALNAGVAATLARQFDVGGDAIARGLRGATWPGRFEIVDDRPLTVLDGAHNPDACRRLAATLDEFAYDRLHLVIGALADKDLAGMADALPSQDRVIACRPDRDRAADEAVVERVFDRDGVDPESRRAVGDAVGDALESAGPDDCILVTGSLFTVAEARERWATSYTPIRTETEADAANALRRATVTDPGISRMKGSAVHRTVRTSVRRRQAEYMKQAALSLGAECAVSGVTDDAERVDVVVMGTVTELRRLANALADQPFDLERVADALRDHADTGSERRSGRDGTEGSFPWSDGPTVMGILNVTPDSFHDGGAYDTVEEAVDRAAAMVDAGAGIVDVGGESTRPGADPIPVKQEIDRVVPVIERIAELDVSVSIDTRKAAVAEAALDAGADIINDVSGFEDPELPHVAAETDAPLVVMHSIETPVDPDASPVYDDVVDDVRAGLHDLVVRAERAGCDRDRIVVDPGIGFGKTARESFTLIDRLGELRGLGCPILVGHSHKSLFERIGYGPDDRTHATVGTTALAVERGADIVRVHDVAENVAAVRAVQGTVAPDRFD